jgi:ubiquinone/menaquinone biosynthesis C-methylase UbiE
VGGVASSDFLVVDLGAGTGNLTIMLLERGLSVIAVEPNDEMREIGVARTSTSHDITWIKANGTETTIADSTVNWVTFGSSFNVVDRELALKETHRILKPKGYFSCMWNHRNLNDSIQEQAENIIVSFVPDYDRGVRREDQRPLIEQYGTLFKEIQYLESDFEVPRTIDEYIKAWRSVKNKYWDLATNEGENLFRKITDKMREQLPETFTIRYTTRAWTAQRAE